MDDFVLRALAAGCGIALLAGPLGSFVVWRRMAYFGDTLAHSALLGVTLGFLLGVNPMVGVVGVCVALAFALLALQRRRALATDTVLGILSHSALSLGLVSMAFLETLRVDLIAYLFGDILSVTPADLAGIYGGGAVALLGVVLLWRRLLAVTVDEDLARVEGMPVEALRLAFMLLIALVIAVSMKIVGILLITSLMIIPAASARRFARTPESMAVLAAVFGMAAVLAGLLASLNWDLPGGPSVVVAAAALFLASSLVPVRR
ncbi:zinc ABC transporter permease subunit ZnuB [Azospirillum sp. SYSU D00513]|uniref:zinc ABC transporter permease subunit ZnuB n=1 Tax=Azospirillum sp. SYSU D00513 TaxID=2812561 RepID=UPI001A9691ED|nr:zinc ABC transporter permease subunit ZnuB [Azospirillum sp. SYSU D00513]